MPKTEVFYSTEKGFFFQYKQHENKTSPINTEKTFAAISLEL